MQSQSSAHGRSARIKFAVVGVLAAALLFWARALVLPALQIAAGGAVIAFLLSPIAQLLEKRLSSGLAALTALSICAVALGVVAWLLVPPLVRQLADLAGAIPSSVQALKGLLQNLEAHLSAHGIALSFLRQPDLSMLSNRLSGLLQGAIGAASNLANGVSRFSLMAVLSYFFLRDREKLLLRLELAVPLRSRRLAVQMAGGVRREMRLYLRGQAMIALAVGALTSLGLMLVGVRSALVLGVIVGILNMIPYLGPVLGAIPVLITALGDGLMTALWALLVLVVVQQLDGSIISPRILGNLTGISPATVLIAVFLGAQAAGIGGMLFALPLLIAARTCAKTYARRRETPLEAPR